MEEVTREQKLPEILRAVEFAKTKGATALKVECEAQFNRNRYHNDDICDECDEGQVTCYDCDEGWVTCGEHCDEGMVRNSADTEWVRCPELCDEGMIRCENDCDEGYRTCSECGGNWRRNGESWSDENCLRFILERVGITNHQNNSRTYTYNPSTSEWLQFARFMVDGSVDSEITFTVRLDDPENVIRVLDMVDAFKALGEAIGNGMNVDGAGLHMSWLFTEDCSYYSERHGDYPPESRPYNYSERELRNFRRAMHHMMPALFFLAAPANGGNWTRGMGYRNPEVSLFGGAYYAIHVNYGAMEFRVFDTCYDNMEQVLDNIVVMSNCLKYLTRTYTGPRSDMAHYLFGNDADRTLDRLYYEENTLDLLYRHLDKLKPSYYTMRQLRKQRGFTLDKGVLKRREETIRRNAELAWKEYDDRWKVLFDIRAEEAKHTYMQNFVERADLQEITKLSDKRIRELVEADIKAYLERQKATRIKRTQYIKDSINQQMREFSSQFRVSFN